MKREEKRRALLISLALTLLLIVICAAFAVALHTTSCAEENCVPCLGLAKLQESFRQFGGVLGVSVGFLALPALLWLATREFLPAQGACNLVELKTRLNN